MSVVTRVAPEGVLEPMLERVLVGVPEMVADAAEVTGANARAAVSVAAAVSDLFRFNGGAFRGGSEALARIAQKCDILVIFGQRKAAFGIRSRGPLKSAEEVAEVSDQRGGDLETWPPRCRRAEILSAAANGITCWSWPGSSPRKTSSGSFTRPPSKAAR